MWSVLAFPFFKVGGLFGIFEFGLVWFLLPVLPFWCCVYDISWIKPVNCASKRRWLKPHPAQNSLPCLNACQQMTFLGKKKRRPGNQETGCTEREAEGRLLCIGMPLLKCSAATTAGHPDEHGSTSNANSLIWLLNWWAAACASPNCVFALVKCVFLEAMMSEQIASPINKILSKGKIHVKGWWLVPGVNSSHLQVCPLPSSVHSLPLFCCLEMLLPVQFYFWRLSQFTLASYSLSLPSCHVLSEQQLQPSFCACFN